MLYIGLMSGTSTDGVDAVLCRLRAPHSVQVLAHQALPMPSTLRAQLLALNHSGPNELHNAALAANRLAHLYAACCLQLLKKTDYAAADIVAAGVHGQTVRHAPDVGYSWQLNAPALLAELTQLNVIADFRSRDIAAGGQGAPLVPLFHQAVFSTTTPRVVLNLGGIANISVLRPKQVAIGFDTGPANALMDEWIFKHHHQPYDAAGQWAASGQIHTGLLAQLLQEPWLAQPPPKSTGRDLFNSAWLQQQLSHWATKPPSAVDVQATLAAFTAQTISQAIQAYAADATDIVVCGGGAYNDYVCDLITSYTQKTLLRSDELGLGAQCVEAAAFAWLAYAYMHNIPANHPAVTGAKEARILGAWYKA